MATRLTVQVYNINLPLLRYWTYLINLTDV